MSNPDYEHDKRLDNVNPSQYRIWHDGQNVLIPVGKSISNPLQKETVLVNTRVYSEINKSFFTPPYADFTTSDVNIKRFDIFRFQTWRDYGENGTLPYNNPNIDYNGDLNLTKIVTNISQFFSLVIDDVGEIKGFVKDIQVSFCFLKDNIWKTPELIISNPEINSLIGNIFYACNANQDIIDTSIYSYPTGLFIQNTNLPITLYIRNMLARIGNTKIELFCKNLNFIPNNNNLILDILGGM